MENISVGDIVAELRGGGVTVFVAGDRVSGRAPVGRNLTIHEQALGRVLRQRNDEAVAWLQAEAVGARAPVELRRVSIEHGLAVGRAIKAGKAELLGMARLHIQSSVMDLTYRPLEDFELKDYLPVEG